MKNQTTNLVLSTAFLMIISIVAHSNILTLGICFFLIPALLTYIICNHGIVRAILSSVAVFVFYTANALVGYTGISMSFLLIIIMFFISGYIIGVSYLKEYPFTHMLCASAGVDMFLAIIITSYSKYIMGADIAKEIQTTLTDTFSMQFALTKSMFPDAAAQFADIEGQIFSTLYVVMPGLVPFIIFVLSVVIFILRYLISKALCKKYIIFSGKFTGGFDTFSLDNRALVFFAVCILGMLISTTNKWFMIFFCAALCMVTVFILVAFAVIDFKLKTSTPVAGLRYLIVVLICILCLILGFIIPVLNPFYVLIFMGITDVFFDYRKLRCKKR